MIYTDFQDKKLPLLGFGCMRLPVVEGRRLVGMVTLGDLSHREDYSMETAEALSEITANVKIIDN